VLDATEDVLAQAMLRLAEATALRSLGDARASSVQTRADEALDALGLSETAWRVAFSVAASGVDLVAP